MDSLPNETEGVIEPNGQTADLEFDLNYWKKKANMLANEVSSLRRSNTEAKQAKFLAKCYLAELGQHGNMYTFALNSPDIEDWEFAWNRYYALRAAVAIESTDVECPVTGIPHDNLYKLCKGFLGSDGVGEATKILNDLASAYMFQELRNANMVNTESSGACLAKVDYALSLVNFLVDMGDELLVVANHESQVLKAA